MKAKPPNPPVEVNLDELDRIIDSGMQAPLSEADGEKLKNALHALAKRAAPRLRSTEKSRDVIAGDNSVPAAKSVKPARGHGRNGVADYTGASRVRVRHKTLEPGDRCPECRQGKVYPQREPHTRIRIVGQAPLQATVFEMESLRCNGCGQVFTAEPPVEATGEKYDETAAAMIAQLRYGSGMPFQRLERLQKSLGIPLPAGTQWDVVEQASGPIWPAFGELVRQAAQGEVMHNDDTGMRILKLAREPAPEGKAGRTGVFTSGILSKAGAWMIALYFSGWKHAGENLADVLQHRLPGLAPLIQMCDALSRNAPRLTAGVRVLLAYCLAHGRRQFVDVADNFPEQCRYVLEILGGVWHRDQLARERRLTPEQRLVLHQEHSGPAMKTLQEWMQAQLDDHLVEPNSGLGKAIQYMLRHWTELTLFLREAGAPLDNNIVERMLKKAILHRKNSLFYKTMNGAAVGDLFMSLIHTCELNGANPFDYLTELQRHAEELRANPSEWMPWNYRQTIERLAKPAAA
jgi:transposase